MLRAQQNARVLATLPKRGRTRQQSSWSSFLSRFTKSSDSPLPAADSSSSSSFNGTNSAYEQPVTSSSTAENSIPSTPAPTFTSINASEISHFSRLSSQWWDEKGEFGLLHKMNPVRMEFVRAKILAGREDDEGWTFANRLDKRGDGGGGWLGGMDVLDVGCGGGLLSESLARVGGTTLGIDASPDNIAIATTHASQDPFLPFISPSPSSDTSLSYTKPGSLRYRHTSAEQLHAEGRKFDVVCSMEVLEHVDQPGEFLKVLGDMVKPGGHLILSTISRTPLSQFLTITMAEHVLRLVTPGTHTYSKFIKPSELLTFVRDYMGGPAMWESDGDGLVDGGREGGGLTVGEVRGIVYDPIKGVWRLWKEGAPGGTMVNYMFHMRKKMDAT